MDATDAAIELSTMSSLKDLVIITVAAVSVTISVMMYFNARKSLLLPLRTEVIKKQVELLTNLLNLTSIDRMKFFTACDFSNIFKLNVAYYLEEMGCKVEFSSPVDLSKATAGAILTVEDDEVIHAFQPSEYRKDDAVEYSQRRWQEAKAGDFKVQLVHLTPICLKLKNELIQVLKSPYLPTEIKPELTLLITSLENNLKGPMKYKIEDAVVRIVSGSDSTGPFDFIQAYNEFNRNSVDMTPFCDNLVTKVRKILKVDEPW